MTLDLVLLLLDENIYDENQSVKILWCSYSYEFAFKRSKTNISSQRTSQILSKTK